MIETVNPRKRLVLNDDGNYQIYRGCGEERYPDGYTGTCDVWRGSVESFNEHEVDWMKADELFAKELRKCMEGIRLIPKVKNDD